MLVDALMEVILKSEIPGRNVERLGESRVVAGRSGQDRTKTAHEEFLLREALPKQLVTYGCGIFRPFQLWCVGCDGDMVLSYARMLETFRESIPRFRYHLLVSDSDLASKQETLRLLEESGGLDRPGGKIELRLEYLERETLRLRKPQDVIVCGQKLEFLVGGSVKNVLTALCKLLFPGRYLLGEEDCLGLYGDLPLTQVEERVFRRTG